VPPNDPEQPSTTPGHWARSLLRVGGRRVVGAQGNGLVMRRSSVRFRQAAPPKPPGQRLVPPHGGFVFLDLVVRVVVRVGPIIHRLAKETAKPKRTPGQIETLPSGSLRVKLYAGLDPWLRRSGRPWRAARGRRCSVRAAWPPRGSRSWSARATAPPIAVGSPTPPRPRPTDSPYSGSSLQHAAGAGFCLQQPATLLLFASLVLKNGADWAVGEHGRLLVWGPR
jgi:hypothetical protein